MTDQSPKSPTTGAQLSLFDAEIDETVIPAVSDMPLSHRTRRRAPNPGWPPSDRFPYNDPTSGQKVGDIVLQELRRSHQPLIITGYTSLPMIIDLLAHYRGNPRRP